MARIEGKCIGDCSKCQLLENGEVDMVPCILDQIFGRVRKQERELKELRELLRGKYKENIQLAGLDEASTES